MPAGPSTRSPPPFVFDAFVLLYSYFLPTPVRNVTNRAKKRAGRHATQRTVPHTTSTMRQRDCPFVALRILSLYCSLFAIAWSISLSSAARCSAEPMAPTMGSPTMLPFWSIT